MKRLDKGLIIRSLVLTFIYGFFLATVLISYIRKSALGAEKWGAKPLWIVVFAVINLYVIFFYKFMFEALTSQTYELIGMYSSWYYFVIVVLMIIFIAAQLKNLRRSS